MATGVLWPAFSFQASLEFFVGLFFFSDGIHTKPRRSNRRTSTTPWTIFSQPDLSHPNSSTGTAPFDCSKTLWLLVRWSAGLGCSPLQRPHTCFARMEMFPSDPRVFGAEAARRSGGCGGPSPPSSSRSSPPSSWSLRGKRACGERGGGGVTIRYILIYVYIFFWGGRFGFRIRESTAVYLETDYRQGQRKLPLQVCNGFCMFVSGVSG